jgi:hypothetical protein
MRWERSSTAGSARSIPRGLREGLLEHGAGEGMPGKGDPTASENVVLVHGGFVDGSGWEGLYGLLKKDGYNVSVVQNPTLSLEDDAAVTKRVIDAQGARDVRTSGRHR